MTQIPQPPGLPVVGNIGELDKSNPSKTFSRLADTYGPVYRLNLLGRNVVIVGSQDVVNDLCDEKRFHKVPTTALQEVRNGVKDGLFTAFEEEENWGLAHRILMPKFGPMAMAEMYPEMYEIASQLAAKWARDPAKAIDPTEDFTKLTLDSIALCAMDTRFNSYYRESMHPFVGAMVYFLGESGQRALRPGFISDYVYRASTRQYFESIEMMKATAKQAIEERRRRPSEKADLLNAMLHGRDAKTGKGLSDDAIINNAITFLIAGHETTSGMLSFLFVLFLQNPVALRSAQEEVDRIVGKGPITFEHMSKLPYIMACLRETLRLWPTAPSWGVQPRTEDEKDYPMFVGKERYQINKGDHFIVNLPKVHRDPAVYGEDAEFFRPERMLDENFNKLPPNSWKPFGNGARACIGRAFAIQEAQLIVAMLLQNFNFQATNPSYVMETKSTLTVKPFGFTMHATLREGLDPISLERRLWGGKEVKKTDAKDQRVEKASLVKKKPMAILFGSNTGTCEALAQSLANSASSRGYNPIVKSMDAGTDEVTKDQPVVVITASYEGEPPDNACHFVDWLKTLKEKPFKDTKFAVFGCGNHDWVSTFHKIPKICDELLAERGGQRIAEFGSCDVAEGHIFDDFDNWSDKLFWPGVATIYGEDQSAGAASFGLDVELNPGTRASDLRHEVREGVVVQNKTLTADGQPAKKHIEIQLPSGVEYKTGDYLAVLPLNPDRVVKQVMARFQIPWDGRIIIKEGQHTPLPTGKEMQVYTLLSSYVELNLPATQKNVTTLANYVDTETIRKELEELNPTDIAEKHISVLNLLERYPACDLPFGDYLGMLSPLRVRQYSISSSPLVSPTTCTLTYGVLDTEAKIGGKRYLGTASNYLAELSAGDRILVSVRPSHQAFHPPLDVENIPSIMICAGSGLAPFHGFAQERAKQLEAGRALAPAMLFVGCRDPDKDVLYADEFRDWAAKGVVDVRYAFSRAAAQSAGCKYVQDRLWHDRKEALALWQNGGKIFVCGNNEVGEGVREVFIKTSLEDAEARGEPRTREDAEAFFTKMRNERYASDVFA